MAIRIGTSGEEPPPLAVCMDPFDLPAARRWFSRATPAPFRRWLCGVLLLAVLEPETLADVCCREPGVSFSRWLDVEGADAVPLALEDWALGPEWGGFAPFPVAVGSASSYWMPLESASASAGKQANASRAITKISKRAECPEFWARRRILRKGYSSRRPCYAGGL